MIQKVCNTITKYMAVIVLVAAMAAFLWPGPAGHIRTVWVAPMLGCVMFGMGMTLELRDFAEVFAKPKDVMIGFVCQFTIMPLLAVVLSRLFSLPAELAVGVMLVGCCPGGTASNVITYLAKGNLALSVGLTTLSTLFAPLMTPLLVKLTAGALIPVDFWGMFLSILEVVIAPVALGLLIKRLMPAFTKKVVGFLPAFSSIIITLIVMAVVAVNAAQLHTCGLLVIGVVILHNLCGFALGFGAARLLHLPGDKVTAVSLEVGMQNSGLACSLAATHFSTLAMAPVPGAVFSVWHNLSGALAARFFARRNAARQTQTMPENLDK